MLAGFFTLVEHFMCETFILCKTSSPNWGEKNSYIWQLLFSTDGKLPFSITLLTAIIKLVLDVKSDSPL